MGARHVFLIPNGVAWCTASLIAAELEDDESALFVLCRSFEAPKVSAATCRMPFHWNSFPHTLRVPLARAALRRFRAWWETTESGQFHLYLPHFGMPYYQLLAAMPACLSVSYIEEGTAAYYAAGEWRARQRVRGGWRGKLISLLGYAGGYRRDVDLFEDQARRCYGLNEESFPGARLRTWLVGDLADQRVDFDCQQSMLIAPKASLSGDWDEVALNAALDVVVAHCLEQEVSSVALKAHPAEGDDGMVTSLCESKLHAAGLAVQKLGQSVVLEGVLARHEVRLYHMGSSIDLYTDRLRGTPIYMGLLRRDADACVARHLDRQPKAARKLVEGAIGRAARLIGQDRSEIRRC